MIQYLSKISKNTSKNKKIQRFSEALLAPSSGPQFKKSTALHYPNSSSKINMNRPCAHRAAHRAAHPALVQLEVPSDSPHC